MTIPTARPPDPCARRQDRRTCGSSDQLQRLGVGGRGTKPAASEAEFARLTPLITENDSGLSHLQDALRVTSPRAPAPGTAPAH
ncbi:hypothetical protein [Amycolatopsis coloradensis]|uniref:hypothetical protein n=1 Tax=Amycolatopsis coloradensis TaxID=76021 RepID=UPI0011789F48|nr:hypothetical protein [Amycolatopsis coloradensis]